VIPILSPQTLSIIAAVVTALAVVEALRRGIVPERFAALWIFISALLLVLAIFPAVGDWAARITGVQVPLNLLLVGAAITLLLVSVQFSYEIGKLDSRTRRLAEDLALLQSEVNALRNPDELRIVDEHDDAAPAEDDGPR
jgi:hypothetical protein